MRTPVVDRRAIAKGRVTLMRGVPGRDPLEGRHIRLRPPAAPTPVQYRAFGRREQAFPYCVVIPIALLAYRLLDRP